MRALLVVVLLGCGTASTSPDAAMDAQSTTDASSEMMAGSEPIVRTAYTESMAILANPERGFFHQATTHSHASPSPLSASTLQKMRTNEHRTMIRRNYCLAKWKDLVNNQPVPIEQSFLDLVKSDFDTARATGVKLIVRFAYTYGESVANEPATNSLMNQSLAVIDRHISDLAPVLHAGADVIAALDAGFIGPWGELHTSNLANAQGRGHVIDSLASVLPGDRAISIRTPWQKQEIYGKTAIGEMDAFAAMRSTRARVGHVNDCFLATGNDQGTYKDATAEKAYLHDENRFLPMTGETCELNPPTTDCTNAKNELALVRMSALHFDYHPAVVQQAWTPCIAEIENKLGYRFVMMESRIPARVRPNARLDFAIDLKNVGYTAPFNPRSFLVTLRGKSTLATTTSIDPRRWLPDSGTITVNVSVNVPNAAEGTYDVLLSLPDPRLPAREEYAIRFANDAIVEPSALHRLGAIQIANAALGPNTDASLPTLQ